MTAGHTFFFAAGYEKKILGIFTNISWEFVKNMVIWLYMVHKSEVVHKSKRNKKTPRRSRRNVTGVMANVGSDYCNCWQMAAHFTWVNYSSLSRYMLQCQPRMNFKPGWFKNQWVILGYLSGYCDCNMYIYIYIFNNHSHCYYHDPSCHCHYPAVSWHDTGGEWESDKTIKPCKHVVM